MERFGAASLQFDEVVIRAYKVKNMQRKKGSLFVTPLALYFYAKSLTNTGKIDCLCLVCV